MPDPRTVLAEIQARADAADPAPWKRAVPDSLFLMAPNGEFGTYVLRTIPRTWDGYPSDEAVALAARNVEFIAHARDDVPRLVAALTAVLDAIDGPGTVTKSRLLDALRTTLTEAANA